MTKLRFNPQEIVIALITSYPDWYDGRLRNIKDTDKIRGDLALDTISKAREEGYTVVVGDWQTPQSFHIEVRKILDTVLIKRRSSKASPGKRQVLKRVRMISGIKVIVLTEPEKTSLIEDCMSFIIDPILKGRADIVIPKRNEELFKKTYPSFQYESETEGNRTYNEELIAHKLIALDGNSLDMFFGPIVFVNNEKIFSLFVKRYHFTPNDKSKHHQLFDVEGSSNVNFFPIVQALRKGYKVLSVEVPFEYPILQRQNEERGDKQFFMNKRRNQELGLVSELRYFLSHLEKLEKRNT